jgi:uncharacterized protein YjiS (DUF1127 family)
MRDCAYEWAQLHTHTHTPTHKAMSAWPSVARWAMKRLLLRALKSLAKYLPRTPDNPRDTRQITRHLY